MTRRLLVLAALLARRHGPAAVAALAQSARAWGADPADEGARRALVSQLEGWARRAGGAAGRAAARLARELERRRVSVRAWERDLMTLRYDIVDMAHGPVREAAVRAYACQARAGVHLVSGGARPEEARRGVRAALRAERAMLRRERLREEERAVALEAVEAALGDLEGAAPRGRAPALR